MDLRYEKFAIITLINVGQG